MTKLDCIDRESALGTASAVLGIPVEQLERVWRPVDPDNRSTGDFLRELGRASMPGAFHSVDFHAIRAVDPEAFRREGVAAARRSLPRIWAMRGRLAGAACAYAWAKLQTRSRVAPSKVGRRTCVD